METKDKFWETRFQPNWVSYPGLESQSARFELSSKVRSDGTVSKCRDRSRFGPGKDVTSGDTRTGVTWETDRTGREGGTVKVYPFKVHE